MNVKTSVARQALDLCELVQLLGRELLPHVRACPQKASGLVDARLIQLLAAANTLQLAILKDRDSDTAILPAGLSTSN